jgi:protein disulfide-isomerase
MEKFQGTLKTLLLLGIVFISSSLHAEDIWLTDFPAAQKAAQEKGLILLAAFVGSDWRPWCRKLEAEVFAQPEFNDFARNRLVLFQADFPKHKALPEELKKQNQELGKQFSIKSFPTVLLLDMEGKEIGRMGYKAGGAVSYLEAIKANLPKSDLGIKAIGPPSPAFLYYPPGP